MLYAVLCSLHTYRYRVCSRIHFHVDHAPFTMLSATQPLSFLSNLPSLYCGRHACVCVWGGHVCMCMSAHTCPCARACAGMHVSEHAELDEQRSDVSGPNQRVCVCVYVCASVHDA